LTPRGRLLWVCYRLTEDKYERILAYQHGRCAGCGRPPGPIRLAVDHCHKTGRIRGLLCWLCNRAIGIIRDNATTAANLGGYLASPPAPLALGEETFGLIGQAKPSKKVKVYGPPTAAKKTEKQCSRKR
jgi:Recombination endonuclease VII